VCNRHQTNTALVCETEHVRVACVVSRAAASRCLDAFILTTAWWLVKVPFTCCYQGPLTCIMHNSLDLLTHTVHRCHDMTLPFTTLDKWHTTYNHCLHCGPVRSCPRCYFCHATDCQCGMPQRHRQCQYRPTGYASDKTQFHERKWYILLADTATGRNADTAAATKIGSAHRRCQLPGLGMLPPTLTWSVTHITTS